MAASIGEQLRLAREERGIGLREICDQTRISVHYLEAIEANDYKRLPGGVFNRSFIKAYAKCVGYDERHAAAFESLYRHAGHALACSDRCPRDFDSGDSHRRRPRSAPLVPACIMASHKKARKIPNRTRHDYT